MKTSLIPIAVVLVMFASVCAAADKDKRDKEVIKPPAPPVEVPKDGGKKRSPVGDKISDYKPKGPSVKPKEPPSPPADKKPADKKPSDKKAK